MLNTAREGADEGRRQRGRRKEKKKEKERKRLGQHLFSLAVLSPALFLLLLLTASSRPTTLVQVDRERERNRADVWRGITERGGRRIEDGPNGQSDERCAIIASAKIGSRQDARGRWKYYVSWWRAKTLRTG